MNKADKITTLERKLEVSNRQVLELKAQLAMSLGVAFDCIPKAADYHGSVVILTLTALGGKEIIPPVAIRDGLSTQAIDALQNDLRRSFELATHVNPAMIRKK